MSKPAKNKRNSSSRPVRNRSQVSASQPTLGAGKVIDIRIADTMPEIAEPSLYASVLEVYVPEVDVVEAMHSVRQQAERARHASGRSRKGVSALSASRRVNGPSLAEFLAMRNEDFVEKVFSSILCRNADNRGFYHYMRRVETGSLRVDVLNEVLASDEALRVAADERFVPESKWHDRLRREIVLFRENTISADQAVEVLPFEKGGGGSERSALAISITEGAVLQSESEDIADIAPIADADVSQVAHRPSKQVEDFLQPKAMGEFGRGEETATTSEGKPRRLPKTITLVYEPEVDVARVLYSLKELALLKGRATRDAPTLNATAARRSDTSVPRLKSIPLFRVSGLELSPSSRSVHVKELLWGTEEAFLERAYDTILGRKPDSDGKRFYLAMLEKRGVRVEVLSSIVGSDEARRRKTKIVGLGSRRAISRLSSVPLFGAMFRNFADRSSVGYVHLTSLQSLQDEEFVRVVYRRLLGRMPDASGAETYVRALRSGADKTHLIWDIRHSPEGRHRNVPVGGAPARARLVGDCRRTGNRRVRDSWCMAREFPSATSGATLP